MDLEVKRREKELRPLKGEFSCCGAFAGTAPVSSGFLPRPKALNKFFMVPIALCNEVLPGESHAAGG